ncbi:MAG TPA: threonine ammonia-lyase [Acidimicrobiales bacterium]|nr:threonine ammonia-lyase [Acidimicrobiales bacterium]
MTVTYADVEAAAATIAGHVVRTPSSVSQTLSEIFGCTVIVKFENLQFTAAYKERGARNRLEALTAAERSAGVVAVSAGNHAQAVARHAALLGIPVTIVMPRTTPFVKISRTRHLGATVELHGDDLAGAMVRGQELVAEGRTFIHPFDDPLIVAGQGTAAVELLTDHPDIDCLVVPVGGGGLIAGCAVVAEELASDVELFGVETEVYPSMARSLEAGAITSVGPGSTLAEGIAVSAPGAVTFPIVQRRVREVLVVSEAAIEDAVNLVLEIEKTVVEGAAAAGIAALAEFPDRFRGRTVGVILTGGNIDPRVLASIIERGLVRAGRLARIRVGIDDRPGALAALLTIAGEQGANLIEVSHQRLFADVSLRSADVDLVIEAMDAAHRDAVVDAICAAGYRARLLPLDAAPA